MTDSSASIVKELGDRWLSCGICPGDTVLLHSSASRTFKSLKERSPEVGLTGLLESFLSAVGPAGTLLLPLFNFDFTKGTPFDMRTSPSHMGALTETARAYPGAVRTGHPIYSFAVIGARAERFRGIENFSGYGADSPFALLREMRGKIAILDLPDQHSMTFYHYVEEMEGVDYRYHKKFTGPYTDLHGNLSQKTFGLFVRDVERGVQTHVDPMGERLWEMGLYSGSRPKTGTGLRVIETVRLYEAVVDVIRSGMTRGLLYRIESNTQ